MFVTNPGYQAEVAVFYPAGVLAEALTLSSRSITEKAAEVLGTINPAGAGPVTSCRFEYVPQSEYSSSEYSSAETLPCTPGPEYADATNVGAKLIGLEHATTYHYRIVATDTHRSSRGLDQTFTTGRPVPDVATGPALNLQPNSATVLGSVGPGSGPPVSACFIEYVPAPTFATSGYTKAAQTPCEPKPKYPTLTTVSANLERLEPNSTYHYRVIALESEGERTAEDREFSTSAAPKPEPQEPPKEPIEPPPTIRVPCTRHACNHLLHGSTRRLKTWTSARFPVTYAWQAAIYSHGHWLAHTKLIGGCVATFRGKGLVVQLNGCHGHVRVRYVGAGKFTVVWQLYK